MNYRTGKILLITSLLLLPAAWSPAWGEEPAFLYTHIHREGSSVTREESRVEKRDFFQNHYPFRRVSEPAFCAGGGRHGVSLSGKE